MWTGAPRRPHNRRRLACAAAISVCSSFVLQCVSMATKWWVYINWRFNTTVYLTTDLGLWQKCEIYTELVNNRTIIQQHSCSYDVLAEMVRAADFKSMHILAFGAPIAALGMTISGSFTLLLSSANKRPSSQLVAAILFIITGMASLTGFILFIDHASEEINYKEMLASQSGTITNYEFEYGYGISLILFGLSVIFSEFSGFAYGAFYLHYYRCKYVRRLPQFAVDDNGRPLNGGRLKNRIAVATSRCLNQEALSDMHARLNTYRAPSRSCNDLTHSNHRYENNNNNSSSYSHSHNDHGLNHTNYKQIRGSIAVDQARFYQYDGAYYDDSHIMKAISAQNIKSVWHSYAHERDIELNGECAYPCPPASDYSFHPAALTASATTLYSRITEV